MTIEAQSSIDMRRCLACDSGYRRTPDRRRDAPSDLRAAIAVLPVSIADTRPCASRRIAATARVTSVVIASTTRSQAPLDVPWLCHALSSVHFGWNVFCRLTVDAQLCPMDHGYTSSRNTLVSITRYMGRGTRLGRNVALCNTMQHTATPRTSRFGAERACDQA